MQLNAELTVYRIQDSQGRGPGRPGFSQLWVRYRKDHENLIPWFIEFGPVHENAKDDEFIGCGCRTKRQLKRWFTKREYKTLLAFGYNAVEMKANRALGASKLQCLFTKKTPLNMDMKIIELY